MFKSPEIKTNLYIKRLNYVERLFLELDLIEFK
jgi:hypothetical protein